MKLLTIPTATQEFFEKKARDHVQDNLSKDCTTLEEAREAIAHNHYGVCWYDLRQFCVEAAELTHNRTMRLTRRVAVPPKNVWSYFIEPERLALWHIPTQLELAIGARFEFENAWQGQIGALETERFIRFDADEGGCSTFEVQPSATGSQIIISDTMAPHFEITDELVMNGRTLQENQPGGPGTHWSGVLSGWHKSINLLVDELTETTRKNQLTFSQLDRLYLDLLNGRFPRSE